MSPRSHEGNDPVPEDLVEKVQEALKKAQDEQDQENEGDE